MSTAVFTGASIGTVGSVRSAGPHLRLTRRGRVVLTTLAAIPVALGALFFAVNGGGAVATDSSSGATFDYITVSSGESLWQIAGEVAPNADPREVISDIVHLNQLPSSEVQAGARIAIPLEYSH
jgi:hypothetical protein